jgi:GNAT superfamily N-acetyltransferase
MVPNQPIPDPTSGVRLRPAAAADIPAIVRISNLAYEVENAILRGPRTDPEDIAQLMAEGRFLVLGDPEPRASIYFKLDGQRSYLGLLAVDPAWQGRGFARILVAAAEAACREAGSRFMDLTVVNLRVELFPFYARLGYAPGASLPFPRPAKVLRPCHLIEFTKPLLPLGDL